MGFHNGELTVQRHAGVQAMAARLEGMVAPAELRRGTDAFLASARFAALTARDRTGRLWTSPLIGPPGFLHADTPTELHARTSLAAADPLVDMPAEQPVGLVVIDFTTRRRLRINGHLTRSDTDDLTIAVEQAYGNCPQYIHPRTVQTDRTDAQLSRDPLHSGTSLQRNEIDVVRSADTFFLGTTHPASGNDASHRGGPAGFVSATPRHLSWPDYPGNNMFNSFGNLAVDPSAALLFVDPDTGTTLHLSGTATVQWNSPDDRNTGRRVEFAVERVVTEQRNRT
ncbi:pyridoxamine 5'-phosphate oxidase family protein [Actinomycetes bacterium M1A6_2h]